MGDVLHFRRPAPVNDAPSCDQCIQFGVLGDGQTICWYLRAVIYDLTPCAEFTHV